MSPNAHQDSTRLMDRVDCASHATGRYASARGLGRLVGRCLLRRAQTVRRADYIALTYGGIERLEAVAVVMSILCRVYLLCPCVGWKKRQESRRSVALSEVFGRRCRRTTHVPVRTLRCCFGVWGFGRYFTGCHETIIAECCFIPSDETRERVLWHQPYAYAPFS